MFALHAGDVVSTLRLVWNLLYIAKYKVEMQRGRSDGVFCSMLYHFVYFNFSRVHRPLTGMVQGISVYYVRSLLREQ